MKTVELYVQSEEWQKARQLLLYAAALPDRYHRYSYSHLRLAQLEAQLGRREEAIALLEEAVDKDANFVTTKVYLGSLYRSAGQTEKAIRQYREALKLDPDNEEAKSYLTNLESKGQC